MGLPRATLAYIEPLTLFRVEPLISAKAFGQYGPFLATRNKLKPLGIITSCWVHIRSLQATMATFFAWGHAGH